MLGNRCGYTPHSWLQINVSVFFLFLVTNANIVIDSSSSSLFLGLRFLHKIWESYLVLFKNEMKDNLDSFDLFLILYFLLI